MRKINFFKIITLMIVAAVVFTSCKKDEPNTPVVNTTDLEFEIMKTDFLNHKGSDADVPECSSLPMDYVKFVLDGDPYYSEIFTANGKLLTQVVKVDLGTADSKTIWLTEFLVYNNGPDGIQDNSDDILLRAAPAIGSLYYDLMVHPLEIQVDILKFTKKQVIVDVLCFEELYYLNFGFTWFETNLITIERQCWFGDICTGKLEQYEGSLYAGQSQGLQMDMPAIMKIDVFKKDADDVYNLIRSFENIWVPDNMGNPTTTPWLGEGDCMEVYWANDENLDEYFKFDLYVWLPVGDGMDWVFMESWAFEDDACPNPGNDGVNDFVVGYCQLGDVDYTYLPYQNLPLDPITMYVGSSWGNNSTTGGYIDLSFIASEIAGTDIDIEGITTLVGWCGDKDATISAPGTYTVQVIGSLNVATTSPLLDKVTPEALGRINWLFNHLQDWYAGINKLNIKSTHPDKAILIQNAIWALIGDIPPPTSGESKIMHDAAYPWTDYKPMPGDFAAVYLYTAPHIQTLFVQVDP